MAMEHEKKQESSSGLGVGLGVDINLKLNQITDLVHTLNSALRETTSNLTGIVSDVVNKIKEFGPEKLKSQAREGGFEDQYTDLVSKLREAANRGEEQAGSLLRQMGESTARTGSEMEESGREGREEATH
jgi:hypothetical protein